MNRTWSTFAFVASLVSLVSSLPFSEKGLVNRTVPPMPGYSLNDTQRMTRWMSAAFDFLRNLDCEQAFLFDVEECNRLKSRRREDVNIYVARRSSYRRLVIFLPDGELARRSWHDLVIAIDPYPGHSWGHFVLTLIIDFGSSKLMCGHSGGIYIGFNECLKMAVKRRCQNVLIRRLQGRSRRCQINFLPLVFEAGLIRKESLLKCQNSSDYASCPREEIFTQIQSVCNPMHQNTHRCKTVTKIKANCKPLQRCDHGIIIAGDYHALPSHTKQTKSIKHITRTLRGYGFRRSNINIFHKSGVESETNLMGDGNIYPAAMKFEMRYHLRKLCQSKACADSLVVYLKSPTSADGAIILWDTNGNGLIEENERYEVEELLADLSYCQAQTVHMLVDQSYGERLIHALRRADSDAYKNLVVVFAAGNKDIVDAGHFARRFSRINHNRICTSQIASIMQSQTNKANPVVWNNNRRRTIFGAECDVYPPLSDSELRVSQGCQNIPTGVWIHQRFASLDEEEEDESENDFQNNANRIN